MYQPLIISLIFRQSLRNYQNKNEFSPKTSLDSKFFNDGLFKYKKGVNHMFKWLPVTKPKSLRKSTMKGNRELKFAMAVAVGTLKNGVGFLF